jgi:CO/xanthine dehydrogenase FAD-binding subunit
MDLGTVEELVTGALPADWRPGDAWLAGGTWLFSEPQPQLRRLLDLTSLGWPALRVEPDGLVIAATCTIAELYEFAAEPPPGWTIGPLIRQCCEAFLASFKIWNVATVGGNLGNALPAGPMISLTAGLGGRCEIWAPGGGTRQMDVVQMIVGDNQHALAPGELIRSIRLPTAALTSRTAFRRQSLTTLGRSAALLIGRQNSTPEPEGEALVLTITASTRRPIQLAFGSYPTEAELRSAIDEAVPFSLYHTDVHGNPLWRRHLTYKFAEEIRLELQTSRDHPSLPAPEAAEEPE